MKQGKRPTRRQKVEIEGLGLNVKEYLIERDTPEVLVLINRYSGDKQAVSRSAS